MAESRGSQETMRFLPTLSVKFLQVTRKDSGECAKGMNGRVTEEGAKRLTDPPGDANPLSHWI